MKIPNTTSELEEAIESLVSSYMDGVHRAARQAVERALSGRSSEKRLVRRVAERRGVGSPRGPRRSAAALDEMCDALDALVRAQPGSSMVQLAEQMGVETRALERPMARLKSTGRARSVMRYFPAVVRSGKE